MMIKATTLNPTELAAVRAVLEVDIQHFGPALKVDKPELYDALQSVRTKFANLARAREVLVSA